MDTIPNELVYHICSLLDPLSRNNCFLLNRVFTAACLYYTPTFADPYDTNGDFDVALANKDQLAMLKYFKHNPRFQWEDLQKLSYQAYNHRLEHLKAKIIQRGDIIWEDAMQGAGERGDVEAVDYILALNPKPMDEENLESYLLSGACMGGQNSLALKALTRGVSHIEDGWYCAIISNNIEMVEHLAPLVSTHAITKVYDKACWKGYLEVVKFLDTKIPNHYPELGFIESCKSKNLELVQYLLERNAIRTPCLEQGLREACRYRNIELARYLISKGARRIDLCLADAHRMRNQQIIDFLISLPPFQGRFQRTRDQYQQLVQSVLENSTEH